MVFFSLIFWIGGVGMIFFGWGGVYDYASQVAMGLRTWFIVCGRLTEARLAWPKPPGHALVLRRKRSCEFTTSIFWVRDWYGCGFETAVGVIFFFVCLDHGKNKRGRSSSCAGRGAVPPRMVQCRVAATRHEWARRRG